MHFSWVPAPSLHSALTRSVIGAFYDVYNELGYGFLGSVYTAALARELQGREHRVSRELAVRIHYRGEYL